MEILPVMIICALSQEARPLIRYFNLKEQSGPNGFRVFGSENKFLIVTGVGRIPSAAGTAYLGGWREKADPGIWINVGIAGSGLRPVGENVMAHKIIEASTGKTWYPSMAFEPPTVTDTLTTVEKPLTGILNHSLVDMEASGFYETALRFTESEWVQCYKIVSDNRENPPERLTPKQVSDLMDCSLTGIQDMIHRLQHLAERGYPQTQEDSFFNDLLTRWHFTEYQKNQVKKLWKKSKALKLDETWKTGDWSGFKSGKEVIDFMEQTFENIPTRPL